MRENILYRLWPDKKAMFIAAIGFVYQQSASLWDSLLDAGNQPQTPAEALLRHEAEHHGELGHYRIVFAGLSETDDPDIRAALADMYQRYHAFISDQVTAHGGGPAVQGAELTAWTLIGLGTMASIMRELGLATDTERRRLFSELGRSLLSDPPGGESP